MPLPDAAQFREAAANALAAVGLLRLRFASGNRQGGSQSSPGAGSSLDFKDHRHYLPGDDPRAINWQAYARSGHYILKLYEREVSPALDLAIDCSLSMWFEPAKAQRSAELVAFLLQNAARVMADTRVCLVGAGAPIPARPQPLLGGQWPDPPETAHDTSGQPIPPRIQAVPWRTGSVRIVVTDLLFPCDDPASWFAPLRREQGRGAIWSPFSRSEAEPDWEGPIDFVDCESDQRRRDLADAQLLAQYRTAYRRHFDFWRESLAKSGLDLVRIPAEGELIQALRMEALPTGWIELAA